MGERSEGDHVNTGGGNGRGGNDGERDSSPGGDDNASLREQDRFLPIANVGRVMKRALPANAKIAKDAKETMQECVSEFISFITGEASDKCAREKRKTINGDDILWAMSTLGFDDYIEPLKVYLQKFREVESEKIIVIRAEERKLNDAAQGSTQDAAKMAGQPGMGMAGMQGMPSSYGEGMGNPMYMHQ